MQGGAPSVRVIAATRCALALVMLVAASAPVRAADLLTLLRGSWAAETSPPFAMTWSPSEGGFGLRWTVPGDGEAEADFIPSARPNLFVPGERSWSMFGKKAPIDPLAGDMLYWARSTTDTIYVYTLVIDEKGAFVLDRYACRPAGDRLEVAVSRRLPGGRTEELQVSLVRTEP
jgi:hypothetical protein